MAAEGEPAPTPDIQPPGIPEPAEGLAVRRVVSLLPSATEILAELGVGSALVGRTLHCDHPAWVRDIPSVGSGLDPDLEVILSLQPELVVAGRMQARLPIMQALEHRDMDVIIVPDERLADVFDAIEMLGGRLGADERAAERVASIRTGLGVVAMQASEERPSVLIAVGHDPIYAAGTGTFLDDILDVAGGRNVLDREGWVHLDREAVLAMRPQLVLAAGEQDMLAERWRFLTDGAGAAVCAVPENITARQGPRVAEAAAAYRECLRRHAPIAPPEP